MRLRIEGAARPLSGEARVPGDKSIGHRAVMLAAIAEGRSTITGLSGGEDNRRTVRAFTELGVPIRDLGGGRLEVDGVGLEGLRAPAELLDCGNSGTTMRLLAGLLAPAPFVAVLDGDDSLRRRPMGRVAGPLGRMGAHIEGRSGPGGGLLPPLRIGPPAGRLRGIEHRPEVASAQVKSALLLAGLLAEGPTRIVEPARSRDHTERLLRALGAPLSVEGNAVTLDPAGWQRRLQPAGFVVPGDLSSAAFVVGAALVVTGSAVTVRGVGVNPTRTGLLDALGRMGADVVVEALREEGGEPVADLVVRGGPLRGARIDGDLAVRAIDELPLLAALAVHAEGTTVIADAAELRVKESDRIAAMAAALRSFGARVEERHDGMVITGSAGAAPRGSALRGLQGGLRGGWIDSRGDHRVAMASAVCALGVDGETRIDDAANVATSFPSFAATLRGLGALVEETV